MVGLDARGKRLMGIIKCSLLMNLTEATCHVLLLKVMTPNSLTPDISWFFNLADV